MKRVVCYAFHVSLISALLSGICSGQVSTGTPPFSSIGGGPFDSVNLGNLNVHFTVPIIHKAGRGIPFSYALSYDNAVYQLVTVNGNQTWMPVSSASGPATYWGWLGLGPVFSPYVTYTVTSRQGLCGMQNNQSYTDYHFSNFVYQDTLGTSHGFNVTGEYFDAPNCNGFGPPNGPQPPGVQSVAAGDGSGSTINVSMGSGSASGTVNSSSGTVLSIPFLTSPPTGSSPFTTTDSNGNKTSFNNGVYTDTLGTTVMTAAGSAPSPTTFAYTGPAGSQHYSVNYTAYNIKTNFACTSPTVAEYTANGVSLVSSISLPDGSQYSFQYEDTPANSGFKTGRISQVTLPTGGVIQYSYTGSNDGINCADGSTFGLQRVVSPGGTWQYSRSGSGTAWTTTVTDPANNQAAISFEELGNNFYETQRRSYQGTTSGTLLSTSIRCYNGQGITTPSTCYNTGITAQITRVTNFRYIPDASGIQAETDSTYDTFGLVHEVDEYDYGTAAVGSLIRKTVTTYATLGNGIVDHPSSIIVEDSGNNVKASTSYGYDESALATPSGTTPQHISVTGSRGNLTSVNTQANGTVHLYRKYTYYNTGMLSTSTDVSTSSTTNGATTTYNYNNTGTPSPSCGNSFATSISEPVGSMSRSFTWDCNGGVLLSTTDENAKVSSTAYTGTNYTNVFWRPYSTTDFAGTTTDLFYFLNGATPPLEFQTESKLHTAFNSGNSILDQLTTTDGFGRIMFSQSRQGPSASNYDTVAICYDNFGRISLTTLPYSTTLVTSGTPCPSANSGTSTTYDALRRTATVSDSGGGLITFSYTKNDTLETRTSPTVSKQTEVDGLGRLKSVCEITSGATSWPSASCNQNTSATGYLTTYAYDLLGNITSVTQNAQAAGNHQTRSYVYDMLGRLTSETNPENNNAATTYTYDTLSSDASCGTITSAGNLLKKLDAAGNASCHAGYDALHRIGNVTFPASTTPSKHFVYDSATVNGVAMSNAKTRLAEAYTCTGACSSKITDLGFSYSSAGQQSDVWELTPHSGTNFYYHVTSNYWPNGGLNTISNLVGLPTITYGADGEGRMSTVSAGTGQNPVTSISYDPANDVTALTYGSSDSDSFTFYSTTGRMHTFTYTMGGTPKTDSGTLNWYSNGSLQTLTITDQINSANTQTCNYGYDSLGRLTSGNCGTTIWNQNFAYDPFGNITKTVPGGSTGTAFQPNYDVTTNRITSTPFTYNANAGALTADGFHSYGWDSANRLSTIDSGGSGGICETYDALSRVVEQAKGASCASSYTEVVYSPSGLKLALMNGSTLTKAFVPLPGGAQAVYNSSGISFYRHPDWLGSSRLATTPSRTCYWDIAYAPFGENYAPPASGCVQQDLNFTGQNQDTESSSSSGGQAGLYDFMLRNQNPVQGRWLSPDPAGLSATDPLNPQSWNRYGYVVNDPLVLTDPTGMDYCSGNVPYTGGGGNTFYLPPPPCQFSPGVWDASWVDPNYSEAATPGSPGYYQNQTWQAVDNWFNSKNITEYVPLPTGSLNSAPNQGDIGVLGAQEAGMGFKQVVNEIKNDWMKAAETNYDSAFWWFVEGDSSGASAALGALKIDNSVLTSLSGWMAWNSPGSPSAAPPGSIAVHPSKCGELSQAVAEFQSTGQAPPPALVTAMKKACGIP